MSGDNPNEAEKKVEKKSKEGPSAALSEVNSELSAHSGNKGWAKNFTSEITKDLPPATVNGLAIEFGASNASTLTVKDGKGHFEFVNSSANPLDQAMANTLNHDISGLSSAQLNSKSFKAFESNPEEGLKFISAALTQEGATKTALNEMFPNSPQDVIEGKITRNDIKNGLSGIISFTAADAPVTDSNGNIVIDRNSSQYKQMVATYRGLGGASQVDAYIHGAAYIVQNWDSPVVQAELTKGAITAQTVPNLDAPPPQPPVNTPTEGGPQRARHTIAHIFDDLNPSNL